MSGHDLMGMAGLVEEIDHARVAYERGKLTPMPATARVLHDIHADQAARSVDPANPKDVAGAMKPDVTLCPPAAILHMAKAMTLGAGKYGAYNWREKRIKMRSYLAAAIRHVQAVLDGEDFDPEEGAGHHLGHAMATCGIVLDAMETGNLIDDRPARGAAGPMIRHYNDHRTFEGR